MAKLWMSFKVGEIFGNLIGNLLFGELHYEFNVYISSSLLAKAIIGNSKPNSFKARGSDQLLVY